MNHYTGSVPDTPHADAWLKSAPCKADPEAMFPGSNRYDVENAKQICRSCPVIERCRDWALERREQFGVWGGLTESERRSILRRRRTTRTPRPIKTPTVKLPPAKTLQEAFDRRAHRTDDGHVLWDGNIQLKFQGVPYTALRVAFMLGHGREPEGPVLRTCDRVCFAVEHLVDTTLRNAGAMCGTRRGYWWHGRTKTPICAPCRQANTDAGNRLRRTGTTKASA